MADEAELAYELANELLAAMDRSEDLGHYRQMALVALQQRIDGAKVVWVHQQGAQWSVVGSASSLHNVPIDLVAAAGETMEVTRGQGWLAAPLLGQSSPAEVLLVSPHQVVSYQQIQQLAQLLRGCLLIAAQHLQLTSRTQKLEALLDLAAGWQRKEDLGLLLISMAQTAARLIRGDRASIFLWDRPRSELVGYPAMGVTGDRLRIRDDQGIAGDVLRTRQPKRWDESQGQAAINSQIGEKLGYVTRSLVAVPLLDHQQQPLGVFEVLNHQQGVFTDSDQQFLVELAKHAATAVENMQRIAKLIQSRDRLVQTASETMHLAGHCPQVAILRETVARVAETDLAVLVLGENGTGKEVVSRSLHLQSARSDQPFIAVNCAAIAETLIESELFGHVKGAFTDAIGDRAGRFEQGTLLLDEIGELSLGGQAKLLRVLEDKIISRVGSEKTIQTDVRIIAATNQDLARLVREKRFREDLYFRLNVVTINLPPLRERGQDIGVLAQHFLQQFAHQIGRKAPVLSESAHRRLMTHSWPGNVRELRNLMERVSYLTHTDVVEETDLAFVLSPGSSSDVGSVPSNMPLSDATDVFQRQYIQRHIDLAGGNLAGAAKQLGMHRSNLYRKMTQLGMEQK
jgi:Nif-specific regulatory protein